MKKIRLATLARLINEQLPQYDARVERGQYMIEREWPGHTAVLSRRTVEGNCLRVYDRNKPGRLAVYECNLAKWYARTEDAILWFEGQGGKVERRETRRTR